MLTSFAGTVSLALATLAGAAAPPPAPAGETSPARAVKVVKDIPYHDGKDAHPVKHKLDLYLPEGLKDFPVLFFVHGGAWMNGDKNFFGVYSTIASAFARQGIGVVVTNYRLSPAVKHPDHVRDVARAFAWVVGNIERHGGRPDRVFVCGHSAGGHLVSLLTTDETYLKEHGLTTKNIRGAIPVSGVYVLPAGFLPRVFGTDRAAVEQAAPIRHARAGLPPFLILYADRDLPGCDRKPSELFCKTLGERGTSARTVEVTESDHMRIILAAGQPASLVHRSIVEFVRKHAP